MQADITVYSPSNVEISTLLAIQACVSLLSLFEEPVNPGNLADTETEGAFNFDHVTKLDRDTSSS